MASSQLEFKDTLIKAVKTLVERPADPLPQVLAEVDPDGPWAKLALKVGDLKNEAGRPEISVPLLDKTLSKAKTGGGSQEWSAGVSAGAALSVDLHSPEEAQQLGLSPADGHSLVAYGVDLTLGGELKGSGKVGSWGKLGLGASARLEGRARWYVQAGHGDRVIEALLSASRHWLMPWDLQGMLRLAGGTDWCGQELALEGQAQLALDLSGGREAAGWTYGLDGQKVKIGLSVGVEAGFATTYDSRFRLTAMSEPAPDGSGVFGVRVRLVDEKASETSSRFQLSAGIDFSALVANAERVLRAAWPELDSALLDRLVKPGSAIHAKLQALIEDRFDGDLAGVVALLAGGDVPEGLRESLVGKLTGGLADRLDASLGQINAGQADAASVTQRWLAGLLGAAAAQTTIDDKIVAAVQEAIEEATDGLKQGIADLGKKIDEAGGKPVDALLARLGELGAHLKAIWAQLDAHPVPARIAKALDRYAAARDKVLGALAQGQRAKINLTLALEQTETRSSNALFEAWFRPDAVPTVEAERLFHALYSGRMLGLQALVAAAQSVGAIADPKGWLHTTLQRVRHQRLTLNFFGREFSSRKSLFLDVALSIDPVTGNLTAARAGVAVEGAIANPWKNRTARVGVVLTMERDAGGAPAVSTAVHGAFMAVQERSNRATVQALIDGWTDAVGAARVDVQRQLGAPPPSDVAGAQRFWRSLTLAVPLELPAADWLRFSALAPEDIDRVALQVALDIFDRYHRDDGRLFPGISPRQQLLSLAGAVLNRSHPTVADIGQYLERFPKFYVGLSGIGDTLGLDVRKTHGTPDQGGSLYLLFQRLAAVVRAPRRVQALVARAAEVIQGQAATADPALLEDRLDRILQDLQDALSPVAVASETWLAKGFGGGKDETVPWAFTAFVVAMVRLSGRPVPAPIGQAGDGAPIALV